MTWPPCGDRSCPVVEPSGALLRRLRTVVVPAASTWWRGTRYAPESLAPPGHGDTRFAPLPDSRHGYFGATRTVALLESALHEASGPEPTIYMARLAGLSVHEVELTDPLRLVDLRDPELGRLGLQRWQLVDTTGRHSPCTRVWAAHFQTRQPGGYPIAGVVWHSRQADLHARSQPEGLLADVLVHAAVEVAVAWYTYGPLSPFRATGRTEHLVTDGRPSRLLSELSALIGVPIE